MNLASSDNEEALEVELTEDQMKEFQEIFDDIDENYDRLISPAELKSYLGKLGKSGKVYCEKDDDFIDCDSIPKEVKSKVDYYVWRLFDTTDLRTEPVGINHFINKVGPYYLEYQNSDDLFREYHRLHWDFLFVHVHFGLWETPYTRRNYFYSNRPNDPISWQINLWLEGVIFLISFFYIIRVCWGRKSEYKELLKKEKEDQEKYKLITKKDSNQTNSEEL